MTGLAGQRITEESRARRDELLSACLDGQLSDQERAHLEALLTDDPGLQAELEAMRQTVALVRSLPQVPIPRNFILPQPKRTQPAPPRLARAAPFLTAATALTTFLFVTFFAGGLLFSGGIGMDRASTLATEPQVETPQAADTSPETPAERSASIPSPVPGPASVEPPMMLAPPSAAPLTEEVDAEEYEGAPEATLPPPAPTAGSSEATPEIVAAGIPEPDAGPPTAEPERSDEAPALPYGEEAGGTEEADQAAEPTPADAESRTSSDKQALPFPGTPWLLLVITLGAAALALAVATVLAWRARRGQARRP